MQCPQCDTTLKLVIATPNEQAPIKGLRGFRIIDLLGLTGLVAVHLIAFPIIAKSTPFWGPFLYLSPTVVTCLIHLRLRLSVRAAVIVHYALTLVWTFLNSLGQTAASNEYNKDSHIDLYERVVGDTIEMAVYGVVLSTVYGIICWSALNANRKETMRTSEHTS